MIQALDIELPGVEVPRVAIADFCRRWKIVRLELFGSAVRGDFGPDSDLDFLYTFADDARWGWDFVTLGDELAALVVRPVDLVSRRAVERSLNSVRKQAILGSVRTVYAL